MLQYCTVLPNHTISIQNYTFNDFQLYYYLQPPLPTLLRKQCLLPPLHTFSPSQTRQLHDVNGWTEEDVADWFYSLGDSETSDLGVYAELFVKNNITGRRLFLLTGDDLLQIGVLSVGHRREILVSEESCSAQTTVSFGMM